MSGTDRSAPTLPILADDENREDESDLGGAATLAPEGSLTDAAEKAARSSSSTALRRGSPLGRYVVLDALGRGGMGVVYAAYDPELDRKLAVKLVKWGSSDKGTAAARSRLLREAQALAKLSHRNIVAVYDVGAYGDSIFVAMEYVDGKTLTEWLAQQRSGGELPSWRDVLSVYVPAARALHAAHEAGIIHRDFKPDNVMIDADGRIVVLDFGLARPAGDPSSVDAEPGTGSGSSFASSSLAVSLTVTGSVMGTPAYMSPEQIAGRVTDAATDQFSFCVSVWMALYGERPFAGETMTELAASVLDQRFRSPTKGSRVPVWLRRALLRGLARRPEDRYPSMAALLEALLADPGRRRRRIAAGVAALGVLLGAGWGIRAMNRSNDPCAQISAAMLAAWGPPQRRAMEAAFRTDAKAYSEESLSRVLESLDGYTGRWLERRTAACEAGRSPRANGPSVAEANVRAACLDGRLVRLAALARVLGRADQNMVARALDAVENLPSPEACEDPTTDRRPPAVPDDPAAQERVESVVARAAELSVLIATGRALEARDKARDMLADAREIGFVPLVAEIAYQLGFAQLDAGEYAAALASLEEALFLARATEQDRLAMDALLQLATLHTRYTSDFELAEWLLRDAEAMISRFGDRPYLRILLLGGRARLERTRKNSAAALEALLEAVPLLDERGVASMNKIVTFDTLGSTYLELDRVEEALVALERAERLAAETLGPSHPQRANIIAHQARARAGQDRHSESLELLRTALEIYEGAFGSSHPNVAAILNGMGLQLEELGRLEDAVAAFERALAIYEQLLGREHYETSIVRQNLGNTLRRLGRAEESIVHHRFAIAVKVGTFGDHSEDTLESRENLADDLRALGRCAEAEAEYRTAITGREEQEGADDPDLGYPLTGLGLCRLRRGDIEQARISIERAIAVLEHDDGDSQYLAHARLALAMTLRKAGEDPARVQELIDAARESLTKEVPPTAPILENLARLAAGEELVDLTY